MILDYYTVTVNENEYEAFMKKPGQICIRTKDSQKADDSFTLDPDGTYTKIISKNDITEAFLHRVEHFYKGVKIGILGVTADGICTIFTDKKETADKLGGFKESHDLPVYFIKTVKEDEIEDIVTEPQNASHFFF